MQPRYKKIIGDITSDFGKNLLLVMAIAIGVFGIGTIGGGYSVLKREIVHNYLGTNPAAATIELENSGIEPKFLDSIKRLPGVKTAVRHATVLARMKIQDKWLSILLFVIDDFKHQGTNKITMIGTEPPPTGAMLVERTALPVMHGDIGERILVQTAHGPPTQLIITGIVHVKKSQARLDGSICFASHSMTEVRHMLI